MFLNGTVTISKAADSMLAMSKIEATFVIALMNKEAFPSQLEAEAKLTCKKLWSKWEAEATLIRRLLNWKM